MLALGENDERYTVGRPIEALIEGDIIWVPAIQGGLMLTTRGEDFDLSLGQDFFIGYLRHTDQEMELYL